MKKTLTWIAWLPLSAVSPIALAVGLGQATVNSYLDAPLQVAIPLLESSGYALDDILVSVADRADFEAAGLEWSPLVASVTAQVVEQQGLRHVRLSSSQAMQEPWLDVLLAIEFPGGQQFRDLTLLFDPQDYSQQASSGSSEGLSQEPSQGLSQGVFDSQSQRVSESAVQRPPSRQAQAPVRPPILAVNGPGNSAYVGDGDTLWGVAERVKPSEASVYQMMLALLDANPSAFPDGNIHNMRAGQTLQVPGVESVLARSQTDAAAEIQAMNETRGRPAPTVSQPAVSASDALAMTGQSDIETSRESSSENSIESNSDETATEVVTEAETLSAIAVNAAENVHSRLTVVAENDEFRSLSRATLLEQLRISQTMLEQATEERELMRAELNALHVETASLTLALNEALAAPQSSAPGSSSTPLAAGRDEASNGSVSEMLAHYQKHLGVIAIALLLGVLVWLRKRREAKWETTSLVDPVIKPVVSPPVSQGEIKTDAETETKNREPNSKIETATDTETKTETAVISNADTAAMTDTETEAKGVLDTPPLLTPTAGAKKEPLLSTNTWFIEGDSPGVVEDEAFGYQKSQAAGLALQGHHRRMELQVVGATELEGVSLAPPEPEAMQQMLKDISVANDVPRFMETEFETNVADRDSDRHIDKEIAATVAVSESNRHFIDYDPPAMSSPPSSDAQSRESAPMQPPVEFQLETSEEIERPTKSPRRPPEEEWDIEEVAFKPLGRDNGDPPKSST